MAVVLFRVLLPLLFAIVSAVQMLLVLIGLLLALAVQ
jgi:hypothetical protein